MKIDTKLAAPLLKDVQNLDPRNAGEFISADRYLLIVMNDIDVIPRLEPARDLGIARFVFGLEIAECLIREYYTPAEGVVR